MSKRNLKSESGGTHKTTNKLQVVLYKGTHCDATNMNKIRDLIEKRWKTNIIIKCWTKNKNLLGQQGKGSAAFQYGDVKDWNYDNKSYSIAIGHSAGSFPLLMTKASYHIAINPAYPAANFPIFHANKDWLIPTHKLHGDSQIIHYMGKHSDMPLEQLKAYLYSIIPRRYEK